jgi:GTP-binding protein LepA
MQPPIDKIRNFAIIAHIDHGKSTLADRLMEISGLIGERDKKEQYLDRMELEQERGITIKAQTVVMEYVADDGETYWLNLIDTPGHVDFSYEVSRSLSACEGVVLVVDATQGVEAQTLSNVYLALNQDAEILPVINKVDLPSADVEGVLKQIEDGIGLSTEYAISVSAKTGMGVKDVLEAVVKHIPSPDGDRDGRLKALIVDSWFDSYVGVVVLLRVMDGKIHQGDRITLMGADVHYDVTKIGVFAPDMKDKPTLCAGEVGFMIAGIKQLSDARVGDTVTLRERPAEEALDGFEECKPMVFSGIFPVESKDHEDLRDALEKLKLNDAAFNYQAESSDALGFGFRCGFLGLLHMEIVQERLEREYGLNLITTSPSVVYKVRTKVGAEFEIHSPSKLPPPQELEELLEPYAKVVLHAPEEYVGALMTLCQARRGEQTGFEYTGPGRVMLTYLLPYAEVVFDFFDKLKSVSRGYASMDYEVQDWRKGDLVRLDIKVNGENVDALSTICHRDKAYYKGQGLTKKLKEFIPRQMWDVAIQAALGNKVIARTTVKAMRKDVTAKCYGGDISRKRKLLEKQKKGKKRMKSIGNVEIPQEAFLAVLKVGDDG